MTIAISLSARYPEERLRPLASTRVLDANGELLYELRAENDGYSTPVELDQISPDLILATLSSEDASFYEHPGIDLASIGRALWLDAREGRFAYGGSTITQQLAKLLEPEPRTIAGKLAEAWDAWRLERTFEKDEILTAYLNRVYYGRNAYGVEAASQRFFGKTARELTLGEASLLAILPRRPAAYDPARFPETAIARRRHVLEHMASRGWISAADAERAASEPIRLVDPRRDPPLRHFLDALVTSEELRIARERGDATLHTAIDPVLQERLEARVQLHLATVEDRAVGQAGLVVLDNETGSVIAMVGSRRYGEESADGSVNATLARRNPGSALKPFVYALAIERGAHPGTRILDAPADFVGYRPHSVHDEYFGWVSYREALASSLNVPAVRLTHELGVGDVAAFMNDAGIDGADARAGLPIALGGSPVRLLDLAEGYATLARGGMHLDAHLTREGAGSSRRVMREETAYLVTSMLSDAGARRLGFGFETPLELPFDVAVKTGTSQSYCDNVVVGYTREVTVAAWAGNFDGEPMRGVLSIEGAAPLFREAMLAAMEGRTAAPRSGAGSAQPSDREWGPGESHSLERWGRAPSERPSPFVRPPGVEQIEICTDTGEPAADCPRVRIEEVARSTRPSGPPDTRPERRSLPVRITTPADGSRIVRDPILPIDSQRIRLEAETDAPRVRFELDGETVAELGPPYRASVPLIPGVHRLRVTTLGTDRSESDEIVLTVE